LSDTTDMKESTVIFHVNRLTFRPEVDDRQRSEALDRLRRQGSDIDAVTSWVVGPEIAARIAQLHERSYQENPELAQLVAEVPSFAAGAVPEDKPQP
jgi:hypothetical protein